MSETVVVSRHINAAPEELFALVTDLTRMGEWSPENNGGSWVGGATAAAVGAKFKGNNSHGKKHWTTISKVTVVDASKAFAFDVSVAGLAVATWRYDIAADGTGSLVTESFVDRRGRIPKLLAGPATGVTDRASHNRAGMERTLEALAKAAES